SLSQENYDVVTATSGAEAVARAMELRPDLITLDIMIPGGVGWDVLHRLRQTPATSKIPVVVVSIVDRKEVGCILGASEYLVKPVGKDLLLETIGKYLPAQGEKMNVMVVDDDVADRHMMADIVEAAGYAPISASTGREAL